MSSEDSPSGPDRDQAAMVRLAAGQEGALNELMERHSERLFRFLVRELQNETEAADLAEESFVRVFQNRQRFKATHKFSTWLYAIALNLVRDRYRWRTRHPEVSAETKRDCPAESWLGQLADTAPLPSEDLANSERARAVQHAIGQLPEELRTAFLLAEYEDLSHAEIGGVVSCSSKAVEMRIYRARQLLRTQLVGLLSEA